MKNQGVFRLQVTYDGARNREIPGKHFGELKNNYKFKKSKNADNIAPIESNKRK
jgi:hypothetical protein